MNDLIVGTTIILLTLPSGIIVNEGLLKHVIADIQHRDWRSFICVSAVAILYIITYVVITVGGVASAIKRISE